MPETPAVPSPQPESGKPRITRFEGSYAGPLPPPQMLQSYEDVCPGAASRILELAEQEAQHRRELEKRALDAQIEGMRRQFSEARLGQIFAFLVAAVFVGCGT